ncbi:MAG: N-acetylmuramoyl-L-alanine amidase [Alphaproteobacteria bacterium]|nr:N-acetylmuramoyl-L-alanine amidase [Alphaproteobacteria bacterium]
MLITERPSPNFTERKKPIELLVLHATQTETLEEAFFWLTDTKEELSSHYLIDEKGEIFRLVPEEKRAHHAGVSAWREFEKDLNSSSIGIEFYNQKNKPFKKDQIKAGLLLCQDILKRNPLILPQNVVAHSDIAPQRKEDPNTFFPWKEFAQNGIGLWPFSNKNLNLPLPENVEEETFSLLKKIGYRGDFEASAKAFVRRFAPKLLDTLPLDKVYQKALEIEALYNKR